MAAGTAACRPAVPPLFSIEGLSSLFVSSGGWGFPCRLAGSPSPPSTQSKMSVLLTLLLALIVNNIIINVQHVMTTCESASRLGCRQPW